MNPEKLDRYLQLKSQEAEITKELNLIKREIRESLPIGDTEINGIKVTRRMQIRFDLDKEAVLIKLGEKGYRHCEKATEYEVVTVKRV